MILNYRSRIKEWLKIGFNGVKKNALSSLFMKTEPKKSKELREITIEEQTALFQESLHIPRQFAGILPRQLFLFQSINRPSDR